jgi:hypothetical protein
VGAVVRLDFEDGVSRAVATPETVVVIVAIANLLNFTSHKLLLVIGYTTRIWKDGMAFNRSSI